MASPEAEKADDDAEDEDETFWDKDEAAQDSISTAFGATSIAGTRLRQTCTLPK